METTPKTTKNKVASYDISRADETIDLAKDLARFIKENKLCKNIQGKEFVNVEGWQYAGSRLGIIPIVESVEREMTEDPTEFKYRSHVRLLNMRTGQLCGAGFAICSNKEQGKKFFQEFAIMSMAQTRAVGKAYRNILAWIIRAAGYEPTPAEEMEAVVAPNEPVTTTVAPKPDYVPRKPAEKSQAVDDAVNQVMPGNKLTKKQISDLLLLTNSPYITEQVKQRLIRKVNDLTPEEYDKAVAYIHRLIEEGRANEEGGQGE